MFNLPQSNGIPQRLNIAPQVNQQRIALPQGRPAVPQMQQHPQLQQLLQRYPQFQHLLNTQRPQGAPVAAPQPGRMMQPPRQGFAPDGFQPPQGRPDFQIQPVGNPQMLPPAPETWSVKY